MQESLEKHRVAFHGRARNVFFQIYQEFRLAIRSLDRQKDENVHQQVKHRYASQLRMQLDSIAMELLGRIEGSAKRDQVNQMFRNAIQDYLQEFMVKARSL